MNSIEFVEGIRERIINSNLVIYQDLFNGTDQSKVTDPYWTRALKLFHSLNNEHKEVLLSIIRQVEVDTVSNFLAILDGVSRLDKQTDEFVLTTEADGKKINGDLQDVFLSFENG